MSDVGRFLDFSGREGSVRATGRRLMKCEEIVCPGGVMVELLQGPSMLVAPHTGTEDDT